ncbi:MAG: zinc ribbon domain-containing protein [Candidatus Omnitrophica bacterium]|nr:zinc ribbon domain-containing protein [Candidatus Omnitrophota bacterium]
MPTYQYQCDGCGYSFEKYQSIMDDKLKKCPHCHKSKLCRLVGSGGAITFKGSGFYQTDYKGTSCPAADNSSSKDTSKPADCPVAKSGACHCCK